MTIGRAEICELAISELGPLLRTRRLSPVEVAEAALDRIAALDGTLRAFCTLDPERVRAQARQAERALSSGRDVGPLCGIPVAIKDLIFTRDLVTTGGSTAYRDFVPAEDDVVVERLRSAGAIILGKTNVPEFGYSAAGTTNPVFGTTRNPWNADRTPGGSSGGSAVAVAARMCAGALGTDGGGSIRSPSSYCGIYGLKPSFGRVPLYPGCRDTRFPGFSGWESLEHIGPMTRTVTDAALILDVIAGPDRRDRHSLPREAGTFAPPGTPDLRDLRVGWTLDLGGYARADDDVRRAVEAAARTFTSLGARVEYASPFSIDPGRIFAAVVAADSDPAGLRRLAAEKPDALNSRIVQLLGRDWSFAEIAEAMSGRRDLYNQLWRYFERFDLLLTPTLPVASVPVDRPVPTVIGGTPNDEPRAMNWYTSPFNLTGSPAASIPCGVTAEGLPIGLQIVGGHLADALVLRASRAFEIASPWTHRPPPPGS
jgi:aspartyl-tRNA(Asn)/glutamyl-tRNA(Gln) amidotransferase subunit A